MNSQRPEPTETTHAGLPAGINPAQAEAYAAWRAHVGLASSADVGDFCATYLGEFSSLAEFAAGVWHDLAVAREGSSSEEEPAGVKPDFDKLAAHLELSGRVEFIPTSRGTIFAFAHRQ